MSISVIVSNRNEPFLWQCIDSLLEGTDHSRFEIIISDDASDPIPIIPPEYTNVRMVRTNAQRGLAYMFDRSIEEAKYETLILMGGDVIVKDSTWIDKAEQYVAEYPNSIGCSVCLSGNPDFLDPNNPADDVKRYGASISPLATTEDLPSDSPMLVQGQYNVEMFMGKWYKRKPERNISEVPTIFGAFYFTSKSWINHINGFDTVKGMKLSGLAYWGGIDVLPSLKTWLCGGKCHVVCDIETLHIWRKSETPLNGRGDFNWHNRMFIAYTCMDKAEADRLVEKVYSLRLQNELYTLPFNLGRKLIRQNFEYVKSVRERNKKQFKYDFDWFCEKFQITKKW